MAVRILKYAWRAGRALTKGLVIRNYREYCIGQPARRALLSYLTTPLLPPAPLRDRVLFSPFGIAQEIPRALNQMGYAVDIVNFDNRDWSPRGSYDLFIGHGGINFERLAQHFGPETTKLYFSTGIHSREWNRLDAARLFDVASRAGLLLPPDRAIVVPEDRAYSLADGILHLGNSHAGATYAEFQNVRGINNAAYPVTWTGWRGKDYAVGRRHFLFYEGPGNVHKGLDRILEAFAGTPLHLHVCQTIQSEFLGIYRKLLYGMPNIHVYGFIRQRSGKFYELAGLCNWVISATCAEGQSGSAVEMMSHGLIPILPVEANIDLGDWGILLPGTSVSEIAATCAAASEMPAAECRSLAEGVVAETLAKYTITHFRESFRNAVHALCDGSSAARNPAASETLTLR